MKFRTPKFWLSINLFSLLLLPLSTIYYLIFNLKKIFSKQIQLPVRIICVGNAIAGGAGKTPVCLALGRILAKQNVKFAYSSRGYGSKIIDSGFVDSSKVTNYFGDEPQLLARQAPTIVGPSRFNNANLAKQHEFDMLIMDDGMQNFSFHKDYSIVVIDEMIGFGSNLLLPAGPLRETVNSISKRTDLFIVIGRHIKEYEKLLTKKVIYAKQEHSLIYANKCNEETKDFIAFCGLAWPQKFYNSLAECAIRSIDQLSYPDHYQYSDNEIEELIERAGLMKANLITTEKDLVRINPKYHEFISILKLDLRFTPLDEEYLSKMLIS